MNSRNSSSVFFHPKITAYNNVTSTCFFYDNDWQEYRGLSQAAYVSTVPDLEIFNDDNNIIIISETLTNSVKSTE